MSVQNGVDVGALGEAVESITADPNVGEFTFHAETEWTDGLKCVTLINDFDQGGERIYTQDFAIEGDEPEQILGQRTAPNAVELLLAALGSCLSVGYAANAAAMGIGLDDLSFEMEGDVDLRGFLGISDEVRPGYNSISCTVHLESEAAEAELDELRERVEATSPLLDVITNAVDVRTDMVVGEHGAKNA